jgi:hypothetical protein
MGERLEDKDIEWFMERQVDSYLEWIGLWLICLLGDVNILAVMFSMTTSPSLAKLSVILVVYIGLISGMDFSVYRLCNILRDQIVLARQIETVAIRDYIFHNRGWVSKHAVDDNGRILKCNRDLILCIHFIVFVLLFLALYL